MDFVLAHEFLDFINAILRSEWLDEGAVWINKYCVTPLCKTYDVPKCSTSDLDSLGDFGLVHSLSGPDGEIPVGGTVNLNCEYPNERLNRDIFDAWPDDFNLTLLCKPNAVFDIPDGIFKVGMCTVW